MTMKVIYVHTEIIQWQSKKMPRVNRERNFAVVIPPGAEFVVQKGFEGGSTLVHYEACLTLWHPTTSQNLDGNVVAIYYGTVKECRSVLEAILDNLFRNGDSVFTITATGTEKPEELHPDDDPNE